MPAGAQETPKEQAEPPSEKLAIVGGTEEPQSVAIRREGDRLAGAVNLLLPNAGGAAATLRLRYYRDRAQGVETLPGTSTVIGLIPPDASLIVKPGGFRQLTLRFTLPAGEPPSRLDGTVVVLATRGKARQRAERLFVPVQGEAKAFAGVRFVPGKEVIQVTCSFFGSCSGDVEVQLEGSGVGEALRDLRAAGDLSPTVTLERAGRAGTDVTLTDLELSEHEPSLPPRASSPTAT